MRGHPWCLTCSASVFSPIHWLLIPAVPTVLVWDRVACAAATPSLSHYRELTWVARHRVPWQLCCGSTLNVTPAAQKPLPHPRPPARGKARVAYAAGLSHTLCLSPPLLPLQGGPFHSVNATALPAVARERMAARLLARFSPQNRIVLARLANPVQGHVTASAKRPVVQMLQDYSVQ